MRAEEMIIEPPPLFRTVVFELLEKFPDFSTFGWYYFGALYKIHYGAYHTFNINATK
jgi:hypothetical protein